MKNSNKKSSILISSAGRRVELVKIWQEAIDKYLNKNFEIICCDMSPKYSAACKFSKKYFSTLETSNKEYINDLLENCVKNNVKLIIPTIDHELKILSSNKKLFEENGVHLLISEEEFINQCRNKILTEELFNSFAVETPKIYEKQNIIFPCFMKPKSGSSSYGAKKIFSKEDLSLNDLKNSQNIFQELIPDNFKEYSCDIYYNKKGSFTCGVVRERLAIREGEISKGITRKNEVYEFIKDKFKKINYARGPITLQLFANSNFSKIQCIEINPRFGGGYPMSHKAGANFAVLAIYEYIKNYDLKFIDNWEKDKLMLRYDSMI